MPNSGLGVTLATVLFVSLAPLPTAFTVLPYTTLFRSAFLEIKNSEFSGNSATSSTGGGAMFVQFDNEPDTMLFLKNSTLSGNMSEGSGSALGLFNYAQVEIKYSNIADNMDVCGGADMLTPS